ncbi:preprotein translocase subunit SecE [Gleimia europaea]|uniref:Protein translocase subunit SecE n=1 Tax=Gleimia europaea ACS-120-V-Col10b TaxID=883069 RepID=A0A9W5VWL8_9ACTO|nr:preprotein translocase subunit SecE [Gleimia europaea]EPD31040.1 preprotein translocase, SecE subunit [Gleimia europaea ACS-120-V-Col10b]
MSDQTKSSQNPNVKEDLNVFGRILLFIRQVIAELKKVIWPSQEEWWTYFLVVLVFVVSIMIYTGLLDFAFGQLSVWVFG